MKGTNSRVLTLGSTEVEVLKVLWSRGPSGAAKVHRILRRVREDAGYDDIAYTTVTTILYRMESKGLVTKDPETRTYKPVTRQDLEDRVVSELSDALDE